MGRRSGRATRAAALTVVLTGCAGGLGVSARGARDVAPVTATTSTTALDASASTAPPTTTHTGPGTTSPGGPPGLDWGSCDAFETAFTLTDLLGLDRSDLECAWFAVPLDHGDPALGTVELAVARRPAGDPDQRLGSLFLNPGGPGGSGMEFLPQFVSEASPEVLQRFDVVGFDPRGVALSDPIVCLTDDEREAQADDDPTPDDEAERQEQFAEGREANADCAAAHPDLVPRMGTVNVARDLDRLRAAVGDEGLTYLGLSYGTLIGSVYAELFPDRVRAMVLDGALPPDSTLATLRDGQFQGFRRAFDRFVAGCGAGCPLRDVRAAVQELVARASVDPIRTFDDRPLTEARAYVAVAAALYDEEAWSFVYEAISDALAGNAGVLGFIADLYLGRRPDGTWTNSDEAFNAVTCADRPERPEPDDVRPRAAQILAEDPFWGPLFAWNELTCLGAPPARDPIPPLLTAPGAPPIVVVGTTGDPATPYEWAEQMAASLRSGVLVTFDGDGHTAYGSSDCVTRLVDDYLLTTAPPPADQVCTS